MTPLHSAVLEALGGGGALFSHAQRPGYPPFFSASRCQ